MVPSAILTDDDNMTDTTRTRTTRPTRLQRSRNDRVLTGVAGGLGTHLGINPWWFRFAFLILTFFGGFGLVVYLAAWLVIPDEGHEDPIISNWLGHVDTSDAGTIFGLVLVGAAAVIVLTQFADISGTLVVAAILFVVGLLLYRGDLTSKRPDRPDPDATHGGDDMTETTTTAKADIAATAGHGDASFGAAPHGGEGDELPPVLPPAPPAYGEPDSGPTEPWEPPPPRERSMLGRLTLAVGLIVVATMALLDVAFTRVDMDPVHYLGAAVAVIGLGLIVGAFIGKALWLIIVGVLLLPALWIAALLPASIDFSAGEFTFEPVTVAEVASPYEQGFGQLTIDLTQLSVTDLAELGRLEASVGFGEIIVRLPDDTGFTLDASVGMGVVQGPFPSSQGIGVDVTTSVGDNPSALELDLEVGAGAITIAVQARPLGSSGLDALLERSN